MTIRFRMQGEDIGAQLSRNFRKVRDEINDKAYRAAVISADNIRNRGRSDIQKAGNFGQRWQSGWQVRVYRGKTKITISCWHTIKYAMIFQTGGTVQGKPLLWIPLPGRGKASPRSYPGGLFSGKSSRGTPLLFSRRTKEPIFFGVSSINQKKRFHLLEIVKQVYDEFPTTYKRA